MTTLLPPEKQTTFILVGATGKLGRSISSHNANVTDGICSLTNGIFWTFSLLRALASNA